MKCEQSTKKESMESMGSVLEMSKENKEDLIKETEEQQSWKLKASIVKYLEVKGTYNLKKKTNYSTIWNLVEK